MKRTTVWVLNFLIAVSAAALLIVAATPTVNDRTAGAIAVRLQKTPLPPETELCASVSAAGKLTGCGNGMQYFGAVLVRSTLTRRELWEHYAPYRGNEWDYRVEPQLGAAVSVVEHAPLTFPVLEGIRNPSGYYIVYSFGESGYPFRNLDLRGY